MLPGLGEPGNSEKPLVFSRANPLPIPWIHEKLAQGDAKKNDPGTRIAF
jgi:hypothetical protein